MVVCGARGDHFVSPSFDDWFDQVLVGDCKTEASPRIVVTSIDVADSLRPVSVFERK